MSNEFHDNENQEVTVRNDSPRAFYPPTKVLTTLLTVGNKIYCYEGDVITLVLESSDSLERENYIAKIESIDADFQELTVKHDNWEVIQDWTDRIDKGSLSLVLESMKAPGLRVSIDRSASFG